MYRIKTVELKKTACKPKQIIDDETKKIAFVGRSNVGKSSLLNLIFNQKIAKISSTPGKTRSINYYEVNKKDYFIDLPGYGYARRSKSEQENWDELMSEFFIRNTDMDMLFVLMDSRHPFTKTDEVFFDWILPLQIPIAVVLTKSDKVNKTAIKPRINETRKLLENYGDFEIFPISVLKRSGTENLLSFIGEVFS